MGEFGEIIMLGLQGRLEKERRARTILEFLTDKMDGGDVQVERRKTLKERLGFMVVGCCGATWGFRRSAIGVRDEDDDEGSLQEPIEVIDVRRTPQLEVSDLGCDVQASASSGMNLAAALAAERQYRAVQESDGEGVSPSRPTVPETPSRVSLMRLLEESDGAGKEKEEEREAVVGYDRVCCVCMGREKGAAFIPCGHTFCRVCSRELWLNRGSCPLCNHLILEILDIF